MATVPGSSTVPTLPQGDNPLAALIPLLTQKQQKVTGGVGDVAGLQALLAQLMPTTTAAGMSPVIQEIFRAGFQAQMPTIYNASNMAGLRPGSTTQQALLVNDLNARLVAEANKAVAQQQQTAGQVATAIAQNTKTPQVTTDKTGVNATNAALALAATLGAKILQGSGALGGGDTTKKKTSGSVGDFGSIMDTIFGPSTDYSIIPGLPSVSTGGINPTGFSATPSGGFDIGGGAGNFLTSLLQGNSFGNAASSAALSAIPVVGAPLAAAGAIGNLLGINEVSNVVGGLTGAIGDIGSAIVEPFGCYITTAVCELDGKPDDCAELQTLREFRDNWLEKQPGGAELIKQYYDQAPRFLAALGASQYRTQILRDFQYKFIGPAVHAASNGNNELAFRIYVDMLQEANDYIRHMEG